MVDEGALLAELQAGRLNACLDVTDPEPPVAGSPLYSLPNCILTPHVAGSTDAECLRLGDQIVNELQRYQAGEPFENEVTEALALSSVTQWAAVTTWVASTIVPPQNCLLNVVPLLRVSSRATW